MIPGRTRDRLRQRSRCDSASRALCPLVCRVGMQVRGWMCRVDTPALEGVRKGGATGASRGT